MERKRAHAHSSLSTLHSPRFWPSLSWPRALLRRTGRRRGRSDRAPNGRRGGRGGGPDPLRRGHAAGDEGHAGPTRHARRAGDPSAQTLEEIIDRRLVLAYARRNDKAPTDKQLQAARTEFEATSALAAAHAGGFSAAPVAHRGRFRPPTRVEHRLAEVSARSTAPRRGPRRISRPIAGSSTAPRWP